MLRKTRPGDQPLPIANDLPRCHDLAIASLTRYVGTGPGIGALLVEDMRARLDLGVARYGFALQPHNGRDFLRDMLEELLDGLAYGQGVAWELDTQDRADFLDHLRALEKFALFLKRLMVERDAARDEVAA